MIYVGYKGFETMQRLTRRVLGVAVFVASACETAVPAPGAYDVVDMGPGGGSPDMGGAGGSSDIGPSGGSLDMGPSGGSRDMFAGGGSSDIGPSDGGRPNDLGPPAPALGVVAVDQQLSLSTLINISSATSDSQAILTIHESTAEGDVGGVIGVSAVNVGDATNLMVVLDRPAVDDERLHAKLRVDDSDEEVLSTFKVSVLPGTPAVSLSVSPVGSTAYAFTGGLPERYADEVIGDGPENQALTFRRGWRYALTNAESGPHPLQLITDNVPGPDGDVVLAGQGVEAPLEAEPSVAWVELEGGVLQFTVSDAFASTVDGYRCGAHTASMRGSVGRGPLLPDVVAGDQALTLSTVVFITEVVAATPGWITVRASDEQGGIGAVLGFSPVFAGFNRAAEVVLDRPATDQESLHAVLHDDLGMPNVYEFPGPDVALQDEGGQIIGAPFITTVPINTPAVRLEVQNIQSQAYTFIGGEPFQHADATIADAVRNQTLTLNYGWRYEVVNRATAVHPFEFITDNAAGPDGDVVRASQSGRGSLEDDLPTAWSETGNTVVFTVTEAFRTAADAYRCLVHPVGMRGLVVVSGGPAPPP